LYRDLWYLKHLNKVVLVALRNPRSLLILREDRQVMIFWDYAFFGVNGGSNRETFLRFRLKMVCFQKLVLFLGEATIRIDREGAVFLFLLFLLAAVQVFFPTSNVEADIHRV